MTIEVRDATERRGHRVVMLKCPLADCGHTFTRGESRADHFEQHHGPEDVGR